MGTVDQPFHRGQQAARHQPGHRGGQQHRQPDDHPAGALLLLVKVDIGAARQALGGRADHPADHFAAAGGDIAPRTFRRHRRARAHHHLILLVDNPELGAPAVRRQLITGVGILLQRAQNIKHQLIVVAQEVPVAVLFILVRQRIAQHHQPLLVAAFNVVDKAVLKAEAHPPVHGDQHQHAGGEDRREQLGGDADT